MIAANRSEESHIAGGLVLNHTNDSLRYSHDVDIFHEAEAELARASLADVALLRAQGYEVTTTTGNWQEPCSFRKASLRSNGEELQIDWAVDAAYRFFPAERDAVLGWRLHLFDMATNKALALAARSVTRDYVDIIQLDAIYPLEAVIWAACGKDPGFTPTLLLEMMRRFARLNPRQLETIQARQLDPVELKKQWIDISERADAAINQLADTRPDLPIGVAFVNDHGQPGWIGNDPELRIHHPSVRGCWPTITAVEKHE